MNSGPICTVQLPGVLSQTLHQAASVARTFQLQLPSPEPDGHNLAESLPGAYLTSLLLGITIN